MSVRTRRLEQEWLLLEKLAAVNPEIIAAAQLLPDSFRVSLQQSPAWVRAAGEEKVETKHEVSYCFPRYFPAVPCEAFFLLPIVHPNVDPENGFACLWLEYSAHHTIVDALVITRELMSGRAVNTDARHVMQEDTAQHLRPTLEMPPLVIPTECQRIGSVAMHKRRTRLSACAS